MLFVGDDWAEDHHDVEILDNRRKRLGRVRLPEGVEGRVTGTRSASTRASSARFT